MLHSPVDSQCCSGRDRVPFVGARSPRSAQSLSVRVRGWGALGAFPWDLWTGGTARCVCVSVVAWRTRDGAVHGNKDRVGTRGERWCKGFLL